jgi:hypothetical protein
MTEPIMAMHRANKSPYNAAVSLGSIALLMLQLAACANTAQSQVPDEPALAAESDSQSAEQGQTEQQPSAIDSANTNQKPPEEEGDIEDLASPSDPEDKEALLDRTQRTVYEVVNGTSQWFDSFFGSTELAEGANVSRGLVSVGSRWDQRDGFKPRFRLKARFPLPALKQRGRFLIGRGDADELIDGSEGDTGDTLPGQFNDIEDDDWLLGLGYSRNGEMAKGFGLGVGIKLSSPVEPFVRVTYRWNRDFGEKWLWRLRPLVFLQKERGAGASINSIVDYVVNPSWLVRSWIILVSEDEVDGLGWTNNFIAYQSLSSRNALSYSVFISGETRNAVKTQDFGIEFRYRKRIGREWLFMELSTSVSWPREFLEEVRESNFGVGIDFEMQFGDWSGRKHSPPMETN